MYYSHHPFELQRLKKFSISATICFVKNSSNISIILKIIDSAVYKSTEIQFYKS